MQVSGLRAHEHLRAHVPGLVLAAVVAAIAIPLASVLRDASLSAPIVLGIVAATVAVACLAVAIGWGLRGRGDFGWLRGEVGRLRRRKQPAAR
jgi:hypothetical protein